MFERTMKERTPPTFTKPSDPPRTAGSQDQGYGAKPWERSRKQQPEKLDIQKQRASRYNGKNMAPMELL